MRDVISRRFELCLIAAALTAVAGGAIGSAQGASTLTGVARVAGRPTANVVIWIDGGPAPSPAKRPRVVLDQRNLRFSPSVLAVPVGTAVEMPNNDRVFHNVFSFHDGKVFDLGVYPTGTSRTVVFDRPGLSRIFCNIHPDMAAYVLAVDSTLVAVSGAGGAYAIAGVPPGVRTYHAWRAGAAIVSGTIDVLPDAAVDVQLP